MPDALSFRAVAARSGRWLPLIGASSLVGSLAALALPLTLAAAVDALVAGHDAAAPMALAATLIAVGVVCEVADAFTWAACSASVTAWLRRGVVRRILALEPRHLRRFEPGDLTARVSAVSADAAQAGPAIVAAATGLLPSIGSLAMLVYLDWWPAAAFVASLGLAALVLRLFTVRTTAAVAAYQAVQGRIAARLSEALAGRRTIAAAGTTDREADRVLGELPSLAERGIETWRVLAATGAQSALVAALTTAGVLLAAGAAVASDRMSPGELLAAAQYAMTGAGIGALTGVFALLARARAATARLAEVADLPAVAYGPHELPEGTGHLEFRCVTVKDNGKTLLDEVDLAIPGGTVAAVVGASGSGKTVLAHLAARLRDPESGEVLLDGTPLSLLSHDALRRAVGCAFERPVLVGPTLAEAIGPGRSTEEVVAVAVAADVHGFASRLPLGYETPLDQAPMSGGEAQRIGLARAFHAERLLVLDDSTSNLDAVTESRVLDALTAAEDSRSRTRLLITHREATAARADLVVWLDSGRIRAVGPHERLRADPNYRKAFS